MDLSYSMINESFVYNLSNSNSSNTLKTLKLRKTNLNEKSIKYISKIENLVSLDLKKNTFQKFPVHHLFPLKQLKELKIDDIKEKGKQKKKKF